MHHPCIVLLYFSRITFHKVDSSGSYQIARNGYKLITSCLSFHYYSQFENSSSDTYFKYFVPQSPLGTWFIYIFSEAKIFYSVHKRLVFLSLSFLNSCLQLFIQFSDLFVWDTSFCGIRWFPCTHMLNTALLNTQWGPSGNLQGPPLYHSFRESAGSGRVLIPFCMTRNIL